MVPGTLARNRSAQARCRRLALILGVAYSLGSIPFGYLLVRDFPGEDVRKTGSGNIGATNVSRKSPALGALTLFLDAAKGFCRRSTRRHVFSLGQRRSWL